MGRSSETEGGPRPTVFARLRVQAERKNEPLRPARWIRWLGWGTIAALFVSVLVAAQVVHPW